MPKAINNAQKKTKNASLKRKLPSNSKKREVTPIVPDYLTAFRKKCVIDFDVSWLIAQLNSNPPTPTWFRTLLTKMLVGWALCPTNKKVRKAMAWHSINQTIHLKAAAKDSSEEKSYYNSAFIEFFLHRRFQKIYRPLGGFNSRAIYSYNDIRERIKEAAKNAEYCMPPIDILVNTPPEATKSKSKNQSLRSMKNAKWMLDELHENRDDNDPFSPSSEYRGKAISSKNFEKYWKTYKQSAEFVAALYCIRNPIVTKTKISTVDKLNRNKSHRSLNMLHELLLGNFDRLPYRNSAFQKELIGRAAYFSQFLTSRRSLNYPDRFPDKIDKLRCEVNIFSTAAHQQKTTTKTSCDAPLHPKYQSGTELSSSLNLQFP
jgi:hypothetical protein